MRFKEKWPVLYHLQGRFPFEILQECCFSKALKPLGAVVVTSVCCPCLYHGLSTMKCIQLIFLVIALN